MNAEILYNGHAVAPSLAASRGLNYGDGVFRTCLIYNSEVIDLQEQTNKLVSDSKRLGLELQDAAQLMREAWELATGHEQAVLKMFLMRAGDERSYRSSSCVADRLLRILPAPQYPADAWTQGIRLFRSSFRLAAQPALAGIKHLNRLEQVLASQAWEAGADEGILCDDQGRPVCGTRSNLFWVKQGALVTPRLDRCGVAGLMRDKVLQTWQLMAPPARITEGSWDELQNADEVFVTNSLIGIWPVQSLGAWRWDAPGPVTRRLMDAIAHPRLLERK